MAMTKSPVIVVIAAVVLLLAAVCGAYCLGFTEGQRNGRGDSHSVALNVGTPRITYKLKVYVYSGEDVDKLPVGFEPDALVSRGEESVASRAGAPVFASESNPYSVFTPVRQGEGYSLFVTEPLCYDLVMLYGSIYTGNGVENRRIEPESFDETEYRCIGEITNLVRYRLPENDLETNIRGAGDVFAGEDNDTIYVRVGEFDEHHYLRLQKTG